MTDTRKRWFKVGTALGMVPDGVPSEKTEKFSNFLNFLKMSFFQFFNLFFIKNMLLWDTFERGKKLVFWRMLVNGMGLK